MAFFRDYYVSILSRDDVGVCGLLKTYRVCQCKRTVETSSTHKLKTVAYLKGQLYLIHDF